MSATDCQGCGVVLSRNRPPGETMCSRCEPRTEASTRAQNVDLRTRLAAAEARALRAERVAAFTALCLEHQAVAGSEHREACDEYIAAHYAALEGLERYSEENARLREAILAWWAGARPVDWTVKEHVRSPHVNLTTSRERRLACVAAALVGAAKKEVDGE